MRWLPDRLLEASGLFENPFEADATVDAHCSRTSQSDEGVGACCDSDEPLDESALSSYSFVVFRRVWLMTPSMNILVRSPSVSGVCVDFLFASVSASPPELLFDLQRAVATPVTLNASSPRHHHFPVALLRRMIATVQQSIDAFVRREDAHTLSAIPASRLGSVASLLAREATDVLWQVQAAAVERQRQRIHRRVVRGEEACGDDEEERCHRIAGAVCNADSTDDDDSSTDDDATPVPSFSASPRPRSAHLVNVHADVFPMIASYFDAQSATALASTCRRLRDIFESHCEPLWLQYITDLRKRSFDASAQAEWWGTPKADLMLIPWSARWSYALWTLDHVRTMQQRPPSYALPGRSDAVPTRFETRAAEVSQLLSEHPFDVERVFVRAWLLLFRHGDRFPPLVREWARIQANYAAGNGNIALSLAAAFPFDQAVSAIGKRLRSQLGIPTRSHDRGELMSKLSQRSLDTAGVESEADVTLGEVTVPRTQRYDQLEASRNGGSGVAAAVGGAGPPPASGRVAPKSRLPRGALMNWEEVFRTISHPYVVHHYRAQRLRSLYIDDISKMPPAVSKSVPEARCRGEFSCDLKTLSLFGRLNQQWRLSQPAERRFRRAQRPLLEALFKIKWANGSRYVPPYNDDSLSKEPVYYYYD
jgi:hypothetical protein